VNILIQLYLLSWFVKMDHGATHEGNQSHPSSKNASPASQNPDGEGAHSSIDFHDTKFCV